MSKSDKKIDDSLLGSSTTPEAQKLPTTQGAENTADVPTTEAGSATHLNAYREEIENLRGELVGKANDVIDKAIAAIDEAQSRLSQ